MLKSSVSLLSADLLNLEQEIGKVEGFADYFHFDIADWRFVPALYFFPALIRAARRVTHVPFDVHLAVRDPDKYIESLAEAGASMVSIYADSTDDLVRSVRIIRGCGLAAGVSLRPETPVSRVGSVIDEIDMVVVLGTDINMGAATTILPSVYPRIQEVAGLIDKSGRVIEVEADGGIRRETVPRLVEAGATMVVAGSLVYKNRLSEIGPWLRSFEVRREGGSEGTVRDA